MSIYRQPENEQLFHNRNKTVAEGDSCPPQSPLIFVSGLLRPKSRWEVQSWDKIKVHIRRTKLLIGKL